MKKQVYESNFSEKVLSELKEILGPQNISTKKIDRIAVSHGVGTVEQKLIMHGEFPYLPDVVVWPTDTEQVSKIMKVANKYKTVVIPYAGGSGSVSGSLFFNGGICVDVKKLNKFELNDANMTVTTGAGYNGRQLEDELNRLGYTMGHFPQSLGSGAVGGWIGPIAVGTFSTKYGKMDDIVLALEAVTPTGEIVSTTKAPKASIGFNLNYLFLGWEGSTGIVTEATMKIWPKPEAREYMTYTFNTTHDGLEAVRNIMRTGITPAVVRLYDEAEAAEKIEALHYEDGFTILYLGFEGRKDLVELEMKISDECCIKYGGIPKGGEPGKKWEISRYSTAGPLSILTTQKGIVDTLEISAPWDKLEDVWSEMRNSMAPYAQVIYVHFSHFYHTGGMAYMIFQLKSGGEMADIEKDYRSCVKATLEACLRAGGSISHHHGVGTVKANWMEAQHGAGFDIMKKIKKAVDPNNIMNPPVLRLGGDANVG